MPACGLPCEPCGRLCVDPRPGGGIGCQPYCDGQFCLASARVDEYWGSQSASLTVADFVKRRESQILKWPFLGVGALGYISLVHRSLTYGPLVYICSSFILVLRFYGCHIHHSFSTLPQAVFILSHPGIRVFFLTNCPFYFCSSFFSKALRAMCF